MNGTLWEYKRKIFSFVLFLISERREDKYMLKLAMKPGDSIRIGENIQVKLPEDMGCNIRLLVDAPREVEIKRQKKEGEPED